MTNHRLLGRLLADVPLLLESTLLAVLSTPADGDGIQAAEHPALTRAKEALKPKSEIVGNVAVIPVHGTLARKPDLWELAFYGFEDTENILGLVNSASRNPDVHGILLDVDSPGGFMTGGPEIADAVKAAAKDKPVVAWTGGSMASLAYWIGSQASEVIASRSAAVGSIGVYSSVMDYTKLFEAAGVRMEVFRNKEAAFKAAGLPGTSLSDEQRSHLTEKVQQSFNEFRRSVKAARPDVQDEAMKGQTFDGRQAKPVGLVDRVGDRDFAMGILKSLIRQR